MRYEDREEWKKFRKELIDYSEKHSKLSGAIDQLPEDSIEKMYEKIFPKKKRLTDKEMRKSILEYATTWPEQMKEHASAILESCPKPPK